MLAFISSMAEVQVACLLPSFNAGRIAAASSRTHSWVAFLQLGQFDMSILRTDIKMEPAFLRSNYDGIYRKILEIAANSDVYRSPQQPINVILNN